jgi:hypothetical protein
MTAPSCPDLEFLMPYICMVRNDIPAATLQVLDLDPNTSQRSLIYDPPGQTKYVNRLSNGSIVVTALVTAAAYEGLAAWLIDSIDDAGDGGALTDAEANTCATDLTTALDAGAVLDVAAVNVIIANVVAGSGIGQGASVGTLPELLKVLAGGEYALPAGSPADSGAGNYAGVQAGAFTAGTFRHTYDAGALAISIGDGQLATFTDASFEYEGTSGAAVVVYADDGTLLS